MGSDSAVYFKWFVPYFFFYSNAIYVVQMYNCIIIIIIILNEWKRSLCVCGYLPDLLKLTIN